MKDSLIKQCLDILKTDDVRNEIKVLFSPILVILVTLLRNKNVINTFR